MTGGMITQQRIAGANGRVLIRIAAGDATRFDVRCSDADLEQCRAFLRGASGASTDHVRMGEFGPLEVLLTRGADDWSVRIFIWTAAGHGESGGDQYISASIGRAELLQAIDAPRHSPPASPPLQPRKTPATARRARIRRELRTAGDIRRLVLRLCIPGRTPRIVVSIEVFSEPQRQRAQTRITHRAEVGQYQYGGPVLAAAVLLLGAAYIIRSMVDDWKYMLWLALATAGAWFIGRWLGAICCRLLLQLALARLWWRVRSLERKTWAGKGDAR